MVYVLLLMVFIAVATDLRSRVIPNWLTFGGILAGCGFHLFHFSSFWLVGFILMALFSFFLWQTRTLGGGDSKFLMAAEALMGGDWAFYMFVYSLICSLPLFFLYMLKERDLKPEVPYAPAFLGGVFLQILWPIKGGIT